MDIQYLDGDTAEAKIPEVPKYEQPKPSSIPVNPDSPMWYRCENTSCTQCGTVATATPVVTHHEKRVRCPNNCFHGVDQVTGKTCETCGGKGKVIEKEWDTETPPLCVHCQESMVFMQQGPIPAGHTRTSIPDRGDPSAGSRRVSIS